MPPPSSLPPAKKRKTVAKATENEGVNEKIASLEEQLTVAINTAGSLNALVDLVQIARTEDASVQAMSKAIYALYRVYVLLLNSGKLNPGGDQAAKTARTWIWEQLNTYTDVLCGLLQDDDKMLWNSSLDILMSLLKYLSTFLSTQTPSSPQMHASHFRKIVSALLICSPSPRNAAQEVNNSITTKRKLRNSSSSSAIVHPELAATFSDKWLTVHDDVRWFFLRDAAVLLQAHDFPTMGPNLLTFLECLNTFPTEAEEINEWWVPELGVKPKKPKKKGGKGTTEDDSEDENEAETRSNDGEDDWRKFFDEDTPTKEKGGKGASVIKTRRPPTLHAALHSLPAHRAVFTRCWLALLPRLNTPALTARALAIFHRLVLPHLTRPVLLADWIGAAVDTGGAPGLLALNTLFGLMTAYNLDYPSFYMKLYAFLDHDVLHMVHRARFFRILERCLSSTHLPATLLASFVKRLSRLSLSAPPAALVTIIPLTYNLLKTNPSLMVLIHRLPDTEGLSSPDPFDASEPDPHKTHALESSIWELRGAASRHFHPSVSTLWKVMETPFHTPSYALDDFVDHSYATMFETEVRKRVRVDPAVLEEKVTGERFPRVGMERSENDVVSSLWSFGV